VVSKTKQNGKIKEEVFVIVSALKNILEKKQERVIEVELGIMACIMRQYIDHRYIREIITRVCCVVIR